MVNINWYSYKTMQGDISDHEEKRVYANGVRIREFLT